MAIDIGQFDALVVQVKEYRDLLTVRQALAEGFVRCAATYSGATYDLVDQFGQDPIKSALLTPLDAYIVAKRQALIDAGITVPGVV
jgi:hypothetical protein